MRVATADWIFIVFLLNEKMLISCMWGCRWSDDDRRGLAAKVGAYEGAALFITFQSQARGSPFKGKGAAGHLSTLLNQAAGGDQPCWSFVCDFNIPMQGDKEVKRAILFYNRRKKGLDVNWVLEEFKSKDEMQQ